MKITLSLFLPLQVQMFVHKHKECTANDKGKDKTSPNGLVGGPTWI